MARIEMALHYPLGGNTIKVFRDSPLFDGRRWWQLGDSALRELYVCTYELGPVDDRGEYDGSIRQWAAQARELVDRHKGCVFVY